MTAGSEVYRNIPPGIPYRSEKTRLIVPDRNTDRYALKLPQDFCAGNRLWQQTRIEARAFHAFFIKATIVKVKKPHSPGVGGVHYRQGGGAVFGRAEPGGRVIPNGTDLCRPRWNLFGLLMIKTGCKPIARGNGAGRKSREILRVTFTLRGIAGVEGQGCARVLPGIQGA